MRSTAHSVVALGGGHGLAASLSALRRLRDELTLDEITAVVTVADNGGSSGRLRDEFGVLPPGDLRMALSALCSSDDWGSTWADVVQHRFSGQGDMGGHVVGNLLIVSLWDLMGGDHVKGLDWVGRLLGAQGRVLPMATTPIDITASVMGAEPDHPDEETLVHGQVAVATTSGVIQSVSLQPPDPVACDEAVQAVLDADWVVLGPGSWFTSVIPHVMVPELREALLRTDAHRIVVLNLAAQDGETSGFGSTDHLRALFEHVPEMQVHTVLADEASLDDRAQLEEMVAAHGGRLVVADVAVEGEPRHDVAKLAAAFTSLVEGELEEPAEGR